MRYVLHIDLNAFFAQVEINRHPELKGKPIAVGGGIRGVVATASYEARAFGVHSGMPVSDAYKACPDIVFIPGDHREYARQSRIFFGAVKERFSRVEMASIDECYADATEFLSDLNDESAIHDRLFDLQMDLLRRTRLKCSLGLGPTRFMAKMGSDYKKPLGITILLTPKEWESKLWPLPIDRMYGVGKMTAPKLKDVGIETIGDLAQTASGKARKLLGSEFDYLVAQANGLGSDVVVTESSARKSCSNDVTLAQDTTDYDELKQWVIRCSRDVAEQIRKEGLVSRTVCVKLRDADFHTSSRRNTFEDYTDSAEIIAYRAMEIFDEFYRDQPIRLIGVAVEDLVSRKGMRENPQMTLSEAAFSGGKDGDPE